MTDALAARWRHTWLGPQQRHANGSGEVANVSFGNVSVAARGETNPTDTR